MNYLMMRMFIDWHFYELFMFFIHLNHTRSSILNIIYFCSALFVPFIIASSASSVSPPRWPLRVTCQGVWLLAPVGHLSGVWLLAPVSHLSGVWLRGRGSRNWYPGSVTLVTPGSVPLRRRTLDTLRAWILRQNSERKIGLFSRK